MILPISTFKLNVFDRVDPFSEHKFKIGCRSDTRGLIPNQNSFYRWG